MNAKQTLTTVEKMNLAFGKASIEAQAAKTLAQEKAKLVASAKAALKEKLSLAREQKAEFKKHNKTLPRGQKIPLNKKNEESRKQIIATKKAELEQLKTEAKQAKEQAKLAKEQVKLAKEQVKLAVKAEKSRAKEAKREAKLAKELRELRANPSQKWITIESPKTIETKESPEEKLADFAKENNLSLTQDESDLLLYGLQTLVKEPLFSNTEKNLLQEIAQIIASYRTTTKKVVEISEQQVFAILIKLGLLSLGTICKNHYCFKMEEVRRICA